MSENDNKKVSTKKSTSTSKLTKNSSTTSKNTKTSTSKVMSKENLPKVKHNETKVNVSFDITLPKSVFGIEKIYNQAIFDAILSERASRRFANHKVLTRGEVSGTGKKPWRQKGTGNARAGSMRSPIFVGGGRAFGPTTARNYNLKINKKARKNALLSALTLLANAKSILVKEYKLEKPSTKKLLVELNKDNLALLNNVLLVSNDENVFLSARNLPNVSVTKITSLSIESLIAADVLIISKDDIKILEGMVK
ncbi:50S ribosomal protein L4 [Metamycoplasma buccale]|uniref:50S ribosomal protein L4 n=1 Tax=Metamycoplasma buccale TaxID=55602 RepID=UPI00398E61E7